MKFLIDSCHGIDSTHHTGFTECLQYEGWHGEKKHWPYVGWGHKVLPGERFTNDITKVQGDSILRADMMKLCRLFSKFGRDSVLLACLAYQVGAYRLLGSKNHPKSKLIQKLEAGNRDIYNEYISFRSYRGKVVPSIERRRKVEYMLLFESIMCTLSNTYSSQVLFRQIM